MELQASFQYHKRYYKLGNLENPEAQLWFVVHGYGQLASYFIQKFQWLEEQNHCVIAPEGLNRFYLRGYSGRVGATWMTSEDRLRDIDNYLSYLNDIYQKEVRTNLSTSINLLGFSQGTATISRWIAQSSLQYNRLFLWAGMIAEDLDITSSRYRFKDKEVYLIYGDHDEFITPKRLKRQESLLKNLGIKPRKIVYKGGHNVEESVLREIVANDLS